MSLNVDWSKTEAFANRDTDPTFDRWTTWIAYETIVIGMNTITTENYSEFVSRSRLSQHVHNTEPHEGQDDAIRKFIGLSSNASNLTRAAFFKYIRRVWEERL